MAFVSTFDHTNPMTDNKTNLEMLSQREQLMEDIDCIVESYLCGSNVRSFEVKELTSMLCDAVCKNFPTN